MLNNIEILNKLISTLFSIISYFYLLHHYLIH